MGLFSSKPKFIDLTVEGPVDRLENDSWKYRDIGTVTYGALDDIIIKNTAYTAKIVEKMNDNLEYLISEMKHLKEENQILKREIDCLKR